MKFATGIAFAGALGLAALGQGNAAGDDAKAALPALLPGHQIAIFAGGCFWCMEADYEKVPGVDAVTSGYIGGRIENPTYRQVSAGGTGHAEAVQVMFDPKRVSYERLLEVFWHNVDPTTDSGQFCDHGSQYRPEIFPLDDAQQKAAQASRSAIEKTKPFKEAIKVAITRAGTFYPAEQYHQDYYRRNPVRYGFYRSGCGRDARLTELWGDKAGH
ncbi:MAG: peptide-methionine (S)-S-oxide reductase MsrA [Burkholderiaceae bacterium]